MAYEKAVAKETRTCQRCGGPFETLRDSMRVLHLQIEQCVEFLGCELTIMNAKIADLETKKQ